MSEKRISHCQGKGSLTHNNRKFNAKNVDDTRTKDNIVFISQPIDEAYKHLFGAAVERYNARQKRSDRKIKTSYYEHLFKRKVSQSVVTAADKQKSFYEDVVQIGDKNNTGVGSPDAEVATACLMEYMQGFQKRNPNFYVFNAVLHLDEATPHLHIDYIPVGHYKNGIDTRNGIAQALKEMGYGTDKGAIARWREAECKLLTEICNNHGIQIAVPERSRGSLTVEAYKEYAKVTEQVEEKKQENAAEEKRAEEIEQRIETTQKRAEHIDDVIELMQEAEPIKKFGKSTGYMKIPCESLFKLGKVAKGFDEDRKEVKRLQGLLDKATEEIEHLKAEIKKLYQKTKDMLDLKNQARLMKTALKISQDSDYNAVLRELNKRGYSQKSQGSRKI